MVLIVVFRVGDFNFCYLLGASFLPQVSHIIVVFLKVPNFPNLIERQGSLSNLVSRYLKFFYFFMHSVIFLLYFH